MKTCNKMKIDAYQVRELQLQYRMRRQEALEKYLYEEALRSGVPRQLVAKWKDHPKTTKPKPPEQLKLPFLSDTYSRKPDKKT